MTRVKPDIIMIRVSIEGQTGPAARHPGFGVVASALGGITNLLGWPDREPSTPFGGYTDITVVQFAAATLIAALDYRRRTGKGQCLDLSQYETTIHWVAEAVLDYTVNGREALRAGNSFEYAAPHGVYPCKGEDRWCAIAVTTDKEWQDFCEAIGYLEWSKKPEFSTLMARKKDEEELNKQISDWTIRFTTEEVMSPLQAAKIPAGVVQTVEDVVNDPQLQARSRLRLLNHSEIGLCYHLGQSFILSRNPPQRSLPAPCLGEHTEFVTRNLLGMSDDEFVELLNSGILGY